MIQMSPEQIKDQLKRLLAVTPKQWREVEFELALEIARLLGGELIGGKNATYRYIKGGKTTYGAHSEPAQAGNPLLSYETKIVEKLWKCNSWWNPEYELIDQLKRIAKHLIEDEQEAYMRNIDYEKRHGYSSKPVSLDVNWIGRPDDYTGEETDVLVPEGEVTSDMPTMGENSAIMNQVLVAGDERHQNWEKVCAAADGEKELEDYVQAVGESRRLKDVRVALNLKPGDSDKLTKKLKRRVYKLDKNGKKNN